MKPPDTPKTLLRRLADPEAAQPQWARFHALYEPIVRAWLRLRGLRGDALDESVQDVFVRLVRVLRDNPHDPARGLFRTYLGKIVHSVACDRRRALRAHGLEIPVPVDWYAAYPAHDRPLDERLDAQFRLVAYEAALKELRRDPRLTPFQRDVRPRPPPAPPPQHRRPDPPSPPPAPPRQSRRPLRRLNVSPSAIRRVRQG